MSFDGNKYTPVPVPAMYGAQDPTKTGPGSGAAWKPGEEGIERSQSPLWVPGDGARPPPAAAGVVQSHSVELPVDGAEVPTRKATPPRVELAG